MAEGKPAEAIENVLKGIEASLDGVERLGAWGEILTLFFARYYVKLDDPVAAAVWDRDSLAGRCREAGAEDRAKRVETIYEPIITMIRLSLEHKASLWRADDDERVM